jgi:AhpD family alkylhydroperoxidase
MSRVELLTPATAPISLRSYFQSGQPDPLIASLAQVPELLEVALPFIGMTLSPSGINFRSKEIVILRTSAWQGCRYCMGIHSVIAYESGFSIDELKILRAPSGETSIFSEQEQALLTWVDLLSQTGREISETASTIASKSIKSFYTDAEVVELTMVVGATIMLNRYCTALKLPVAKIHIDALEQIGLGHGE